ncbi:MAG: cob(I)yrinic acid a,c-diamide adenosyltransferase [Deltaproteobacteria bacterium]|jgi:cob(I)alamin adenosyltransferase
MKGYVQVYTGDGKGKTTAALGLALRAAGAGLKVFIGQFLKKGEYSEIKALNRLADFITVEQFGLGQFIKGKPTRMEIQAARDGLKRLQTLMTSGRYDVVVVEEGNVAVACGLFTVQDLLALVVKKPDTVELVITGRNAPREILQKADLVTEMKSIRHYFEKGVAARTGIEK